MVSSVISIEFRVRHEPGYMTPLRPLHHPCCGSGVDPYIQARQCLNSRFRDVQPLSKYIGFSVNIILYFIIHLLLFLYRLKTLI